ncbi:MlaD family protein [Nitrospirillum pindoramense]|uniref:Phospholipid/cholesterol/gamma-HCH transport system substrate-binding protein n=1 Tax=Nitrospirillum amazonense TaxID=28077 RepID=A0A560HCW3_9PROT|nr:MlaD family protein [Nitrospirillum amazonense]TWB44222.1 phospholipid/cholesterol/gamma-HCH transport system substrate-binding protein [Nitrospirillum amazonense]
METRASYALVGGFILALTAALFIAIVWLAKVQFDKASTPYRIYFSGSVTGLVAGSPVRYRGVAVGRVTDIRIDPGNVERIEVKVEVPKDTPIKSDAVASLEPVGVTGGVYVEIAGGSQEAPLLRETQNNVDVPVIPSRPSNIASLLQEAPHLLENLIKLSDSLAGFMTPDNQKAFASMLANLASTAGAANGTVQDAGHLVNELRGSVRQISQQTEALLVDTRATVNTVGSDAKRISGNLNQSAEDVKVLTRNLNQTVEQLRGMVEENRGPIRDFTSSGLYDLTQLIGDLRTLSNNLSRVTNRIENDPSGFLFGGRQRGVEVK